MKTDSVLTISVIMMGRPYVISLVDSMRMTVRLMVMRTTPPKKAAAPIRAKVPEYICIPRFLKPTRETYTVSKVVRDNVKPKATLDQINRSGLVFILCFSFLKTS